MTLAQTKQVGTSQINLWCCHAFLAAGVVLLVLLAIGGVVGFGRLYDGVFCVHLAFQGCAVGLSVVVIVKELLRGGWFGLFVGLNLAIALVAITLLGLFPIHATDALVHHLAVPKWWIESGYITSIPWHDWSFYPMLISLGYVGLMHLDLVQLSPLYHCSFFVIMIGLTSALARRIGEDRYITPLAILLISTVPVFLRLSSEPLVDLGLVAFCALSLLYLDSSLASNLSSSRRWAYLLCCGIALGLAAGTKLNGALFAVTLLATLPFHKQWKGMQRWALPVIVLSLAAAYAPWLIRNWEWTGNPIYPLFKGTLGGMSHTRTGAAPYLPPLLHRHEVYGESVIEILLLPVRIFLFGSDDNPRFFDGMTTPFFIFALALPCFKHIKKRQFVSFFGALLYLGLALCLSPARVRYIAPIYPIFAISAAQVLLQSLSVLGRYSRQLGLVVVFLVSAIVALHYSYVQFGAPERDLWANKLTRQQYLSVKIPEYPLIQYVNESLPKSSHVYLVGTSNLFYLFDVGVSSAGYYSMRDLMLWLQESTSSDALFATFTQQHITHLLVHTERVREALYGINSADATAVWNDFSVRCVRPVVSSGQFSLWEIARQ